MLISEIDGRVKLASAEAYGLNLSKLAGSNS